MNDGIIFLVVLIAIVVCCCLYQEHNKEGFAIPAVKKMIGNHVRNQTRPFRRNMKRHQQILSEDFTSMFKKMTKKKF